MNPIDCNPRNPLLQGKTGQAKDKQDKGRR
jgi:hypothetical protein